MRLRSTPASYGAPPAGEEAAGPRPDLRGHRLGATALVSRPQELLHAKRFHGLIGGFIAGLALGIAILAAGVPVLLALLAAGVTSYAVSIWLPTILLAPADRRLDRIVNQLALDAARSWERAYGNVPIPRTEMQQVLWIAAQPDTTTDPDAVSIEGSTLLLLGRYPAARERLERLPDDSPWWRFSRALGLAAIEFDSGTGPGDLSDARATLEEVHGERRVTATAELALEEASRALIRGDDWEPPIARAAATVRPPLVPAIGIAVIRSRTVLPWVIVSQVVLGAALYLTSTGLVG